jgi:chaperonin GroEL (HSP60 family)
MHDPEVAAGGAGTEMVAAIAALALAMGRDGALGKESYATALRRLSEVLGENARSGEPSAMIERIVAILDDRDRDGGEGSQRF